MNGTRQVMTCISHIILALHLAACANTATPEPPNASAELERHKRIWAEQNIKRYEVVWLLLEGGDGAPDRYRSVRVVNRNVLDTRCPQDRCPEAHLRDLRTIEQAFDLIQAMSNFCDVSVLYHPNLGYPTWIRADCAQRDPSRPDFRIILRGFTIE